MLQVNVDRLVKSFGFVSALKGVSFTIEAAENILLLGANGAGKSTLINCLSGLLRPDQGRIAFVGQSRPKIGLVSQSSFLYGDLSIQENLEFFAKLALTKAKTVAEEVNKLLLTFSLELAKNKKIKECSLGILRRASIARALIVDPHLLLLDEPFSNLDPKGREELKQVLLTYLARGVTILTSTNDPDIIELHEGRVLALKNGELIVNQIFPDSKTKLLKAIY